MFEQYPPLTSTPIRHVNITPTPNAPVVYAEQTQNLLRHAVGLS